MNFEKFTENVRDDLAKTLSDSFSNISVEISEVSKLQGQSYTGLAIRHDDSAIAASINLEQFYDLYEDGAIYEDVLQKLTDHVVTGFAQTPDIDVDVLKDYGLVKQHLTIQMVGAESNADKLTSLPHQMMEDMAAVYRISFGDISGGRASVVVTNQMLDSYGITQEQLHQDAIVAVQKQDPLSIKNMDEIMFEMTDGFMGSMDNPQSPMWVATNESRFNGAAVIAYPEFMDLAAKQLEGNFYILPSSTHELLLIPESFGMKAQELKAMVTQVNASEVRPEEKLTDNVYHFDSVARAFEQADKYEKRIDKEQTKKSVLEELGEKKQAHKIQEPKATKPKRKDVPEL